MENNKEFKLNDMSEYIEIGRFMSNSTEEINNLFNKINATFIDIIASFKNDVERDLFIRKYHNTYIKVLYLDVFKNKSNTEEITELLKKFLFCLEQENNVKVYNIEFEEPCELKVSSR